ncbi:MAG TPA: MFS transporter [Bryobacteraceae bacterium]|nr:MFS transporter [Bryobacteraceae bacterium]
MDRRSLISACAAGFAFSANYTNQAPMVPVLRMQFGFDQAAAGLLTTAVFLTHGLMQVPGGKLSDRFGALRMVPTALAWVAIANIAIASSGSFWQLLLWKAVAGIGTGACFTAGARYVVGRFEGRELHLAQGLYGGSIVLGSGFVLFAVPVLLGALGWRGAFIACAAVALIAAALWMALAPKPRQPSHPPGNFLEMALRRELWALGLIQMASFGIVIVVGSWITTSLRTEFGFSLWTAGLMGSAVLLLGIFSRPLGGMLVHRMEPSRLVAGSLLLNTIGCAALAWSNSPAASAAGIAALGFGCGLPYAGVFNRAAALFPGRAGAAMGFVNMIGIVMILAGAPLVGRLADLTGHFQASFYALGAFALAVLPAAFTMRETR